MNFALASQGWHWDGKMASADHSTFLLCSHTHHCNYITFFIERKLKVKCMWCAFRRPEEVLKWRNASISIWYQYQTVYERRLGHTFLVPIQFRFSLNALHFLQLNLLFSPWINWIHETQTFLLVHCKITKLIDQKKNTSLDVLAWWCVCLPTLKLLYSDSFSNVFFLSPVTIKKLETH